MKLRPLYFDLIFISLIELLLFFTYLFGPTPNYFPFDLANGMKTYFLDNVSQFYVVMFIPYLPELLFHIYNLKIAMFFGLSVLWIPSLLVLIWLIRQLFVKIISMGNFRFYYAYVPVLFTLFMPHTLFEIFYFNGSHLFSILSEFFLMSVSILSAILFYISREKKYIAIAVASILLINNQTFSFTFFLLALLLLIFSVFSQHKGKAVSASLLLIVVSVIASFVYLYASFPVTFFPYHNLSTPLVGPTDPNFRVFLVAVFNRSRGLWNVFTMQNYVNDPFFPIYYSPLLYDAILFVITTISLIPFFLFSNKLRRFGAPIYMSLIAFELMNSLANPFISLVWPQNISIFYDLSYVLNNNTVFYYPLQILASISFLISILSFGDFIKYARKNLRKFVIIEIAVIDGRIKKYWKPALAIVFSVVMVTPLLSNISHGNYPGNPVPYEEYEPFLSYFNQQNNASVYVDQSIPSELLSILQTDMYMIENPQLTPDQAYPFSTALTLSENMNRALQPEYMDYLLNMFGYNFIVTANSSLSNILVNSGLFTMALNHSGVQALKIFRPIEQGKLVLLSSSAEALVSIINAYHIFPTWVYSPYLLSLKSLMNIFNSDIPVYAPSYVMPQDLFPYVNGSSYLIPATYTANSYYSTEWEIGYLPQYSQETWTQNIAFLENYSYQSELNVNYGYIFTSTPKVSMHIHYSLPKGKYAVLVNYLESNIGGKFSIGISGSSKYVYTNSSSSYFTTKYLGSCTSGGEINVNISNTAGFNTVAYMMFVPYSSYSAFLPVFDRYINSSSVYSIYSYLGIRDVYGINITVPYSSNNLTYQQLLVLNLSQISSGINSNLSNILFTYPDGSPIYAFISSINAGITHNADIWLRLSGEQNRSLRLLVFNKNISFLGGYLGEAPGISSVYGEYFNAPLVFGNSTSPNAWDWVDSSAGWINLNGSADYINDGIHVIGSINGTPTVDGGFYLPNAVSNGTSFNLYGWTENGTVLQINDIGFVGNSPYSIQDYSSDWTVNIPVDGGRGLFYNFTLDRLANSTVTMYINGTQYSYSSDPYPVDSGSHSSWIWLRESVNDPQYYEYAFIRTLPINGIMPFTYIYKGNLLEG